MNLTEPHCGTDLGLMRTRAEPSPDSTALSHHRQKIFIPPANMTCGREHRPPGARQAPGGGEGTKGISLFIVPKFLVNPDGSLGARNALSCGKVEEKMASTATPPA